MHRHQHCDSHNLNQLTALEPTGRYYAHLVVDLEGCICRTYTYKHDVVNLMIQRLQGQACIIHTSKAVAVPWLAWYTWLRIARVDPVVAMMLCE
jgi:hypothetical protein